MLTVHAEQTLYMVYKLLYLHVFGVTCSKSIKYKWYFHKICSIVTQKKANRESINAQTQS